MALALEENNAYKNNPKELHIYFFKNAYKNIYQATVSRLLGREREKRGMTHLFHLFP